MQSSVRYAVLVSLVTLAFAGMSWVVSPPASAEQTADAANTFDAEHAKATFEGVCTACHATGLATAQGRSRAGWEEVMQRMYSFGLQATDAEAQEILEYLARTYPEGAASNGG